MTLVHVQRPTSRTILVSGPRATVERLIQAISGIEQLHAVEVEAFATEASTAYSIEIGGVTGADLLMLLPAPGSGAWVVEVAPEAEPAPVATITRLLAMSSEDAAGERDAA